MLIRTKDGAVAAWLWLFPRQGPDREARAVQDWGLLYEPSDGPDLYEIPYELAKRNYEIALTCLETVDRKADELFRWAMGGIAGMAAGAQWLLRGQLGAVPITLGILAFINAAIWAAWLRSPREFMTPMDAKNMLVLAKLPGAGKDKIRAIAAASLRYAEVYTLGATRWKAALLNRATIAVIIGLIFAALAAF